MPDTPQNTPDASAFGIDPATAPEPAGEEIFDDAYWGGEEGGEQASPQAAAVEPAAQDEEQPDAQPQQEETPEERADREEQERLYAGRFRSVEDLESSYQEQRDHLRRQTEARRQAEEAGRQMLEYIRSQGVGGQQEAAPPPLPDPEEDPQGYINALVEQRVQQTLGQVLPQYQQQLSQEQQQQALRATQHQTIAQFYARHPEVVPDGDLDTAIGEVVSALGLLATDPDELEFAMQAAQSPRLLAEARRDPRIVHSKVGRDAIRQVAGVQPQANGGRQARVAPPARVPDPRSRAHAQVERRGTGTPAPSAPGAGKTGDAVVDGIWDEWQKELANRNRLANLGKS